MTLQTDLLSKINNEDYQRLILKHSSEFSDGEICLLNEILEKFTFDVVQAQALAQAVMQQVRFDPNAYHIDSDDEDTTGICPHCINAGRLYRARQSQRTARHLHPSRQKTRRSPRPHPALRSARTGQNHTGAHHRQRAGRQPATNQRPRPRTRRRPCRSSDQP